MKKLCVLVMTAAVGLSMLTGIDVSAVNLGRGDANIVISGNQNQTLVGKKFRVYQLFHAENAKGLESIQYTFNKPYENVLKTVVGKRLGKEANSVTEYEVIDYIQTLNTNPVEGAHSEQKLEGSYSEFRYFIEELRDAIVKAGITGDVIDVTSVEADNSVTIGGLEYGYYIVDEITSVEGSHSAASLCMVNTLNPGAQVNIKSDYPTVSKKIQEDDNRSTVGENGWNDMADFEIGQTVPYKFISNVPNMNGYDTYYYAWHDVMDGALTFRPETVTVSIRDEKSGQSYNLEKTEYAVNVNPGNGETFKVEISDLKAIVDREFNQMNELGENIYGQTVVLRYDAVLNDKAANDTGRPGFENDVKLEFSNNPDSNGKGQTGETPWDTVVCFTYKLNGLKTNNHNLQLEGAKFRLYSDEECKNEVYVKKTNSGYNVINRDTSGETAPSEAVEMISGQDGVFTIFGLDGGTYWLKETEAPAGYRPILDPIKLEVIPTFVENRDSYVKGQGATDQALKDLDFEVEMKQFLNGAFDENATTLETNVEEGSGNLTIINHVGMKLPGTGSTAVVLMLAAGTATMVYAVARKKREHKTK